MKILDPGHHFSLTVYDDFSGSGLYQHLLFMKRDNKSHPGGNYPENKGSHPGTNIQEVIRALISRIDYLQKQIPCEENKHIKIYLQECIYLLEKRAAERHGQLLEINDETANVEHIPTCITCGHIYCQKHDRLCIDEEK